MTTPASDRALEEVLRPLFRAYEQAFNANDVDAITAVYTDRFVAAGPQGAQIYDNDQGFRQWLAQAHEFYRAVGMTSTKMLSLTAIPLGEAFALATVHWGSTFEKTGDRVVEFDVSYLVERLGDTLHIRLFVAHADEQKAMKELGLMPDE